MAVRHYIHMGLLQLRGRYFSVSTIRNRGGWTCVCDIMLIAIFADTAISSRLKMYSIFTKVSRDIETKDTNFFADSAVGVAFSYERAPNQWASMVFMRGK